MVVMEMGYDEDVDHELRDALADAAESDLVDEDTDEVVDAVLVWYREDDGDLFDVLADAIGPLAENGVGWLLPPKSGRQGYVEPSEIAEPVPTAGLTSTYSISPGPDWRASRLVRATASPRANKQP